MGNQGLGSQVLGLSAPFFAAASLLSLAAGIALLKIQGLEVFLLAGTISLAVGFFSQSRIGGLTGDGMGATIELNEVACLFFAVLTLHNSLFQL
jgi:cobalamin synthase